ncbi:HotDog domain-containing protein [Protomyces lactucae-debilis]|uniref:HotDog domain-containing protein n=1 Tax=Protomyces lactucae-debilis TaxID=2754530 RepID=A0A1Y2EW43_PROLT|nr:HotDog domain-containing protein [Protomyces lactucae-debilis]ORY75778.1 HotDog domain-containing protein [Protomyces lactucae-debilis]
MPSKKRAEKEDIIQSILSLSLNEAVGLQLAEPLPQTACRAVLQLTTTKKHLTPVGSFHGGLFGVALDTCALMATLNALDQDEHAVTVASAMQIIAGVAGEGKQVTFEMRLLKRTKRLAFLEGEARSADGKLLAKATFTKAIVQLSPKASRL